MRSEEYFSVSQHCAYITMDISYTENFKRAGSFNYWIIGPSSCINKETFNIFAMLLMVTQK